MQEYIRATRRAAGSGPDKDIALGACGVRDAGILVRTTEPCRTVNHVFRTPSGARVYVPDGALFSPRFARGLLREPLP